MKPLDRQRRSGPPHNPGLRDLVEAKRRWSAPPEARDVEAGFRGWHERGYLPHRDEPGLHAVFEVSTTPMAEILESWKKHTANKANRLLQRHGKFWQADYWDTFMRDGAHELETRTNRCQYTGRVLRPDEGSLDHVVPRSRGGKDANTSPAF